MEEALNGRQQLYKSKKSAVPLKSSKGQVGEGEQGEVGVVLFYAPKGDSSVCCRSSPRGEQADPSHKQV